MSRTQQLTSAGIGALSSAFFLTTYLFASANVALPVIGAQLHASAGERALLLGAFAAAFASTLIVFGRIGDNIGRRTMMVIGLLAVAVTAIIAGFAPNAITLVVLRAVQGVAAAAFAPQVLSTIQAVSTGDERRRAVSIVAATAGLGFCGGQLLGGALLELTPGDGGWRVVWWSGAAIALVTAALCAAVPNTRGERRRRLDPVGAVILSIALLTLVAGLTLGPSMHWRAWIWALLAIAVLAAGCLVVHQRGSESRDGDPLLPPTVFAHRPIRIGLVLALLFFAGYGAFVYEYALVTEGAIGLSAFESGLGLLPFGIAFVVISVLQPRIAERLGAKTMPVGALAQAVGLVAMVAISAAVTDGAWIWAVQPALIVVGGGQALQFGPLVGAIMAAVPDRIAGLTGGLVSTAQQAALAIGVAVLGGSFVALTASHSARIALAMILAVHAVIAVAFAALAASLRPHPSHDDPSHPTSGAPTDNALSESPS